MWGAHGTLRIKVISITHCYVDYACQGQDQARHGPGSKNPLIRTRTRLQISKWDWSDPTSSMMTDTTAEYWYVNWNHWGHVRKSRAGGDLKIDFSTCWIRMQNTNTEIHIFTCTYVISIFFNFKKSTPGVKLLKISYFNIPNMITMYVSDL